MKNSAAQKVLITGIKRQHGTITYIRRVSGDLNEICSSEGRRGTGGCTARIIVQVQFQREPGYLYYIDSDGDVARAKRAPRGSARKQKQHRIVKHIVQPAAVAPKPPAAPTTSRSSSMTRAR